MPTETTRRGIVTTHILARVSSQLIVLMISVDYQQPLGIQYTVSEHLSINAIRNGLPQQTIHRQPDSECSGSHELGVQPSASQVLFTGPNATEY